MRLGGAAAPSPAGSQGSAGMPPADERLVAPPVGDAGLWGPCTDPGQGSPSRLYPSAASLWQLEVRRGIKKNNNLK